MNLNRTSRNIRLVKIQLKIKLTTRNCYNWMENYNQNKQYKCENYQQFRKLFYKSYKLEH